MNSEDKVFLGKVLFLMFVLSFFCFFFFNVSRGNIGEIVLTILPLKSLIMDHVIFIFHQGMAFITVPLFYRFNIHSLKPSYMLLQPGGWY